MQAIELLRRKILPTYGISFGLPYPNHPNGYPTNALGDHYPAQNPYFGAIGPNGLNLGLVNVNPLVSVQVQKTEFGDKVVKPLVNLHVTPSANIFEAVGNIFKPKPKVIHNNHYHHHDHYTSFDHDHHDHHDDHIITGPDPIHHFSPTGPSFTKYEIEMIPSKPIFEYHSGPHLYTEPSSVHHFENHHHHQEEHYEHIASHSSSFGPTSFESHSSYPTTGSSIDHNAPFYPSLESGNEHSFGHYPQPEANFGNIDFSHNSFTPQGYPSGFGSSGFENTFDRSAQVNQSLTFSESQRYRKGKELLYPNVDSTHTIPTQAPGAAEGSSYITFPKDRRRRSIEHEEHEEDIEQRSSVLAETVKLQEV